MRTLAPPRWHGNCRLPRLGSIFGQLSKRTGGRQGNGPGLALAGAAGSSPAGAGTGRGAAGGNKVKAIVGGPPGFLLGAADLRF